MWKQCTLAFFEGEAEGDVDKGDNKVTFSEEQQTIMNRELASQKKKFSTQIETLQSQIEKISMQGADADNLKKELQKTRKSLQSKEEQTVNEREELLATHKAAVQEKDAAIANWKDKYTDTKISATLAMAMPKDVFSTPQLISLLRPSTRLDPVVDGEGKETGDFKVVTQMQLPNSKGEMQMLEATPSEIITKMQAAPDQYGNLFTSSAHGGIGGNRSGGSSSTSTTAELAKDPKAYREARKKGEFQGIGPRT